MSNLSNLNQNQILICAICQKSTTLYNYGIPCCNACISFFRRALVSTRKKICKNQYLCFSDSKIVECRFCRFQQCLKAGMASNHTRESQISSGFDTLSIAIRKLSILDDHRDDLLLNYHITGTLKFEKVAQKPLKFVVRPIGLQYTSLDWWLLEQISTIDFLKKLDVIKDLEVSNDKKIFIMSSFFKIGFLRISMMCYCKKQDFITFPDGTDLFPPRTGENSGFSSVLLNKIRCRLIGRLTELAVKKEEFLLLSVIFLCNSDLPNLTDSARSIISSHQKIYSSHLFQYCLNTYQKTGPSRFADLLSLCHVLNGSVQEIMNLVALSNVQGTRDKLDDYHEDLLRFLMC